MLWRWLDIGALREPEVSTQLSQSCAQCVCFSSSLRASSVMLGASPGEDVLQYPSLWCWPPGGAWEKAPGQPTSSGQMAGAPQCAEHAHVREPEPQFTPFSPRQTWVQIPALPLLIGRLWARTYFLSGICLFNTHRHTLRCLYMCIYEYMYLHMCT